LFLLIECCWCWC